jgi:Tfp pilus assembly protein PilV
MITVALGLVLILAGALALFCLRLLRENAELRVERTDQAILIRHQADWMAAYRAELGYDPRPAAATAMAALTPDAADLLSHEVERFLASVTPPAEES